MQSPLKMFENFFNSPSYSRTTGILIILILIAAIPLTVFIAQQQQEIRQRASNYDGGGECDRSDDRPNGCSCEENLQCTSRHCVNRECQAQSNPTATPTSTHASPTPPGGLHADVDRNGCIDIRDFNEWVFAMQHNGTPRSQHYKPDINGDSHVDIRDFNEWFTAMKSGHNLCSP